MVDLGKTCPDAESGEVSDNIEMGTLEIPKGERQRMFSGNLVHCKSTFACSYLTHWRSLVQKYFFSCCDLNPALRAVA